MFTSSMTNEELQAVAYHDYLEIPMRVEIAFEQFINNMKLQKGQRRAIHSIIEYKKIRTKSQNIWNICFKYIGYHADGTISNAYFLYIPIYRGDEVYYLFMNIQGSFKVEKFSPHFLQRYKERYIDYNGIDLHGMHPALYYMLNNEDRARAYYVPEKWTEEEMKERCFLLSKQGVSLVKVEGKVLIRSKRMNFYRGLCGGLRSVTKEGRI